MKTLEPMGSTLPNTDQPRIPQSEYYFTRPPYMGDNVGDDDGTSRTPLISPPCSTLHYRALPCLALLCLSFSVLFKELMYKLLA